MESDDDGVMAEAIARYHVDFARLFQDAKGRDVGEVERLIRDFASAHRNRMQAVDVAIMARVLSDKRWLRKHPMAAVALAWKHRASRAPHRLLLMLARPRFAG